MIKMNIKKRLSVISLIFGMIPLVIVFWLGVKSGLAANGEFQNGIALALMAAIFLGLFSSGLVRYWFFGKQLEKIKTFCLAVKEGCYDVFLPVPNESSDVEDENELVELMRNMNGMAHQIQFNEIQLQGMVTNLEMSQQKIASQNEALEKQTTQLTEMVNKIRNLLDHAGQGFVSFGKDLIVSAEYSAECVYIFTREIAGEPIGKLLYPQDEEQQVFMTNLLTKILTINDDVLRDTYRSLLPQEIIVDGNYIQLDYKFIHHSSNEHQREMMMILTDITKEKAMEEQIKEEKDIVSMIVKVVTQYQDFSDAIEGYTRFCHQEVPKILAWQCSVAEKISTLFMMIHTWKGTFGQLGMQHMVKELHEMEGLFARLRDDEKNEGRELIKYLPDHIEEKLYNFLDQELTILRTILGNEFFLQKDQIHIEKAKIKQIQEKIQDLPDSKQKEALVFEMNTLQYKPFYELLQVYPAYVVELGKRYGKEIETFKISGGENIVNPELYHHFTQTLVHVFRNAVVHGLENTDERLALGKAEKGNIQCEIVSNEEGLILRIVDDGQGIDVERMKKLAVEKKIMNQAVAEGLSDAEARLLIFIDGFSSATYTDDIAGRGIGLYAVRKEVEKLGGEIRVSSQVGMGTEFLFVLPMQNLNEIMGKEKDENGKSINCR